MTDAHATQPGWYPHPDMPGSLRYWDGSEWTDHVAPVPPPPLGDDSSISLVLLVVGILIAAGVIWFVYSVAHANDDLECAMNGQATEDCR